MMYLPIKINLHWSLGIIWTLTSNLQRVHSIFCSYIGRALLTLQKKIFLEVHLSSANANVNRCRPKTKTLLHQNLFFKPRRWIRRCRYIVTKKMLLRREGGAGPIFGSAIPSYNIFPPPTASFYLRVLLEHPFCLEVHLQFNIWFAILISICFVFSRSPFRSNILIFPLFILSPDYIGLFPAPMERCTFQFVQPWMICTYDGLTWRIFTIIFMTGRGNPLLLLAHSSRIWNWELNWIIAQISKPMERQKYDRRNITDKLVTAQVKLQH
jgi:hypothetical protein